MTKKRTLDPEMIDSVAQNMFYALPLIKKRLLHMDMVQKEHGTPLSHVQVLAMLQDVGTMSVSEISRRLGIAKPRRMARQIIVHGHILVNGKKVDIPSYAVKVGDVITLRERSREQAAFKALREGTGVVTPKWLTFDAQNLTGTVAAMPAREDIDCPIEEHLIVELYSR